MVAAGARGRGRVTEPDLVRSCDCGVGAKSRSGIEHDGTDVARRAEVELSKRFRLSPTFPFSTNPWTLGNLMRRVTYKRYS